MLKCSILCHVSDISLYFFFFQAEDGIRDHCVTGVQTCALPIFSPPKPVTSKSSKRSSMPARIYPPPAQIGRASCRERVYISVVVERIIKNIINIGTR